MRYVYWQKTELMETFRMDSVYHITSEEEPNVTKTLCGIKVEFKPGLFTTPFTNASDIRVCKRCERIHKNSMNPMGEDVRMTCFECDMLKLFKHTGIATRDGMVRKTYTCPTCGAERVRVSDVSTEPD